MQSPRLTDKRKMRQKKWWELCFEYFIRNNKA